MKVDFDTTIRDLKDVPVKGPEGKDWTIGEACCTALLSPYQDEPHIDGKEKINRYKIALKVNEGGEQDLTAEEITALKLLIAKAFPPLVVGRAYEILDPSPKG